MEGDAQWHSSEVVPDELADSLNNAIDLSGAENS
jgi:hypothetical protein